MVIIVVVVVVLLSVHGCPLLLFCPTLQGPEAIAFPSSLLPLSFSLHGTIAATRFLKEKDGKLTAQVHESSVALWWGLLGERAGRGPGVDRERVAVGGSGLFGTLEILHGGSNVW